MSDQILEKRAIEDGEMEIDLALLLKDFWRSFRRFWWAFFLLCAVTAGGFYLFWSWRYVPMYEAKATFTVATGDEDSGSYSFYYDRNTADQLSKTFPYVLDSSFFKSTLMEALGTESLNGTITAETVSESNMVTMKVQSSSASDAKAILDTAIEIYPDTARFVLGDMEFHMIDNSVLPQEPYNYMAWWKRLGIGGLIGAVIGVVILGIIALLKKTARTPEEMKKITNLKCLAAVPLVKFKARNKTKENVLSATDTRVDYGFRESLRALQIRTERIMDRQDGQVIMVTSTVGGEGKSTLAVNLAKMFATKGKKVLLIDGDLRRPTDHKILNIKSGANLVDIAEGKSKRECVRKMKNESLWFLGGNETASRPATVLSSEKVASFIQKMRNEMDYIIIDTPPCGMFPDAGNIAELSDNILYVVKYDNVPIRKIGEGISFLTEHKARFLGYVFNAYPSSTRDYGYGRYGYGKYGYGKYGNKAYGYKSKRTYGEETDKTEQEQMMDD
ncbi:hypothetical protein B5F37_00675 [Drancourtella sp. An210]|nr:hypothetical protein B5F37_00675 [Drancourtella sp. An210]